MTVMEGLKAMKDKGVSSTAIYITGKLQIHVKIKDIRKMWGRVDYLIEPLQGNGMQWVEEHSIKPLD